MREVHDAVQEGAARAGSTACRRASGIRKPSDRMIRSKVPFGTEPSALLAASGGDNVEGGSER